MDRFKKRLTYSFDTESSKSSTWKSCESTTSWCSEKEEKGYICPKPKKKCPKIFEKCCPPQICKVCEGKKVKITVCTNVDECIKWQVSVDNGCTFENIPWARGPVLCFVAKKSDDENLYRPIIKTCCPIKKKHVECDSRSWSYDECYDKKCYDKRPNKCYDKKCYDKKCYNKRPNKCYDKKCYDKCSDKCSGEWFLKSDKCKKKSRKAIFICQSVRLIVKSKPRIIKGLDNQNVTVGQPVIFSVKTKPKNVTYRWNKNGISIQGANSSKLIILEAQLEDQGVYSVTVRNECGSSCSEATLIVNPETQTPEITN